MKSVLVVHPQFEVIGGAEIVSLNLIEWLLSREDASVTLLALNPVDFDYVHRVTGLSFSAERPKVLLAHCPRFIRDSREKLTLLKLAFLHRTARELSSAFDLCISTYGEIDFGAKGFQYIHHPLFAPRNFLHRYDIIGRKSALDHSRLLNLLYRKVVFAISGGRVEGFRRNITAVNSKFMQEIVRDVYGIEATVIYPPFQSNGEGGDCLPWEERAFRFVAVGRIAPDKDYLRLLDSFSALSKAFPEATFVIIGEIGDSKYAEKVKKKAELLGLPIEMVVGASRNEVHEILRTSKFFVHAKVNEHFGIAVLEAARAGCLTFVPDSGGQREIVAPCLLRFSAREGLVENVRKILADKDLQKSLLVELKKGVEPFGRNSFRKQLDHLLFEYFDNHHSIAH